MGGRIGVSSRPGEGSLFFVELRLGTLPEPAPEARPAPRAPRPAPRPSPRPPRQEQEQEEAEEEAAPPGHPRPPAGAEEAVEEEAGGAAGLIPNLPSLALVENEAPPPPPRPRASGPRPAAGRGGAGADALAHDDAAAAAGAGAPGAPFVALHVAHPDPAIAAIVCSAPPRPAPPPMRRGAWRQVRAYAVEGAGTAGAVVVADASVSPEALACPRGPLALVWLAARGRPARRGSVPAPLPPPRRLGPTVGQWGGAGGGGAPVAQLRVTKPVRPHRLAAALQRALESVWAPPPPPSSPGHGRPRALSLRGLAGALSPLTLGLPPGSPPRAGTPVAAAPGTRRPAPESPAEAAPAAPAPATPTAAPAALPQAAGPAAGAPPAAPAAILVVDDVDLNRKVCVTMLQRAGLRCDTANHGGEAVEAMPVLDGVAATREIRRFEAEEGAGGPPSAIVAVTANALSTGASAERCREAGMDDFLTKRGRPAPPPARLTPRRPVRKEQLLAAARRYAPAAAP
eukprot:tig00000893_g5346.t1